MKRFPSVLFCIVMFSVCAIRQDIDIPKDFNDTDAYMSARQNLIDAELAIRLDAGISFTKEEEAANRKLMEMKRSEIEKNKNYFPPAHSFLKESTRDLINRSPILEIMKHMPKGGILHVHGVAMGDFRWLVEHATYLPNCYLYQGEKEPPRKGSLRTFAEPPGEGWTPVGELRKAADDVEKFDEEIYRSITLGEEDLSQPDIWEEFSQCFARFYGLLREETIWKAYSRKMLNALIDENVQYVESRGTGGDLEIIEEIRKTHPEFRVEYIAANGRSESRDAVADTLKRILDWRVSDPNRVIGYDLVEEEDKKHTNLFYINEILEAQHKAKQHKTTLPLFLHSGESNWVENENVLDAILLGAKRIGHGLSLVKHPLLIQIAKEREIAIEVCPISNQVLGYIADLRNHPAVTYINSGLPVVICSDDPGIWQSTISHDYYEAFMAWGLDLKGLKQLAKNSLLYSVMDHQDKEYALRHWQKKWDEFISWLLEFPVY
jgi:adenosine deaminase CECR1